jgi:hypothetical protein
MRERFQALLDQRRATHPEEKLAESCMAVARHTSFGPRGMTGNTVLAGSVAEEGDSGLITPFRGNAKAAVRTQGNAVYEVWEVPGKSSGTVKWEARVRTRFDMISTEAASANPAKEKNGGRLVMCLRRGDLVLLPEAQDDKLFIVKKMVVDGRLYLWPARIGTGRANAIFAQLSHPTVNLTGDQGYCLNSGEILRKLNVTRFSISVLGRLRRD